MRMHYLLWALIFGLRFLSIGTASAPDPAGQQAAGIVAGVENGVGGRVGINEKTNRLEVRDEVGSLIDEMALGTSGKVVDVAGQEYRLSFGKDEMGRQSVLVRAGPGMQKPITLEIFWQEGSFISRGFLACDHGRHEPGLLRAVCLWPSLLH